ncbi:MAG TPA: type IV pilus assembly protein PilM [Phycisphaerae bacterium]|nr:type IV pilus assembly protein PilM [Phycisphaerae bacterium]HNU46755.1 type IV pilus assembly protein PilM [Phycisphaerae bacterium]
MAGPQNVWGIDIGRCALKAVRLRMAPEGKVELVAHEYVEHAKILSQPDADRPALISAALEKFLSRNDITRDQVVVGVPGQHTLARFTKLPPVQPKKIPDIVRYEADQQIPFDMDEVIWDYQTLQRPDYPDVEVGIFAMKRELVREHLLYFEQAAIEPIAVQSGPLALYNMAVFDGQLGKDTTVLLDIGAETTDLVIATPDSLWTRSLALGGNNFTEALVKSFKLSFVRAESLKRSAATSKYGRQIFQAMRPVFADLVQELQRSIGFYLSTHRDAEIEKVVGSGDAISLPGLQKYLEQNLGMPVEKPEAFKNLLTTAAPELERFQEHLPAYAVAYGLALQGLDLAKVTTNLLPIEIAKQVVWRKKRPSFAAAAACLVLAGALIWFRQSADMRALSAAAAGADAVLVSPEQAPGIIANGPDRSLSPRARAREVLEAGQALTKVLNGLSGGGEEERTRAAKLIALQRHKTVVPALLRAIHASVPRPEGPLGEADSPTALAAALRSDPVPRDERTQVFIKSLEMRYVFDVHSYDWETNITQSKDQVYSGSATSGDSLPGFICEVTCVAPNKGGSRFIDETFMQNLRKNGRRPGTGFFINRVHLLEARRVAADSVRGEGAGIPGRGGRGVDDLADVTAVAPTAEAGTLDPITNEPILEDWEFFIQFDVVMEDFPQPEGEEAEGEAPEGAPEP